MLEEAAYVEPGFFYETVAPLMLIGNTSLIAISTLTSEINFYTRLLRMRDKVTGLPLFTTLSIQLACKQCIEEGKAAACVHMLHLVPRWQSSDRHVKLKTIMQDRPDLIESELSGLAFDSNQQIFKTAHIEVMFTQPAPTPVTNEAVYIFIDPAAGGPQSDYAVLSVTRQKGMLTVSHWHTHTHLATQVAPTQSVHKLLVGHTAVSNPYGDELLTQHIVETLRLVRADTDHDPGLDVGDPMTHGLILIEQQEEANLKVAQRVCLLWPHELQGLSNAVRRILTRYIHHRLLDQPPDVVRVSPEQNIEEHVLTLKRRRALAGDWR